MWRQAAAEQDDDEEEEDENDEVDEIDEDDDEEEGDDADESDDDEDEEDFSDDSVDDDDDVVDSDESDEQQQQVKPRKPTWVFIHNAFVSLSYCMSLHLTGPPILMRELDLLGLRGWNLLCNLDPSLDKLISRKNGKGRFWIPHFLLLYFHHEQLQWSMTEGSSLDPFGKLDKSTKTIDDNAICYLSCLSWFWQVECYC